MEDLDPVEISADMIDATPVKRVLPAAVDFERGMSRFPWVSICIIAACVVVFIWQLSTGALDSREAIIAAGALHRESVLAGEVWRILTCTLLHGDPVHLIGNMVMLYILALGCEHGFGSLKTGLLYLVSGVAGSLASVTMSPGPSVGASGAIFGMAGGLIVFLFRFRHRYFLRDKRIASVLLLWAGWTIVTGFISTGIDNWAHIGGFIAGCAAGAVLPPRVNHPSANAPPADMSS